MSNHFVGKGSNEIRRGPYATMYLYTCNYYSGGYLCQYEYYFSEKVLTPEEIEEFEAEMKLENPQCEDVWMELEREHPFVTYVWSALDDN